MSIIIELYGNHSIEINDKRGDNYLWKGATQVRKLSDMEVMSLCHEYVQAEIEAEYTGVNDMLLENRS